MNIHLPAILMWTEGVQGFDTLPDVEQWNNMKNEGKTIINQPCGEQISMTYKNGDDWGMVYCCFTHIRIHYWLVVSNIFYFP